MTTTITQDVTDIAGADDNTAWVFYVKALRLSDSGATIVTTRPVRKYPVGGLLTVELDPGPAVVIAADGNTYPFTVPDTDSELWPLIQAAVSIPPSTRHQELVDAVEAWLELNGSSVGGSGPPRRPSNNVCVAIGASITQWGDVYHYPPTLSGMYLHQLAIESMQRIRDGGDFATGGYTFAQIQSTHLPQVLALSPAPGACIIGECTNDIASGVSFTTTVGILKAMVAALLDAGIVPILSTLAPDDAHATKPAMAKWNRWIRRYAALNGFALLDIAAALTGANGAYADASYTGDNLHPTDLGHRLIAQQGLGDGLADIFPPNSQVLTSRTTIDLTNLFGSGSLNWGLFTTNTSGVGTGLTNVGSGGTVSIVAPDAVDNLRGNWQRIATSTGQAARALLTFLSGWSPGDRLALSARVRAQGFNGANSYYDVQTQMARSSGTWTQGGSSVSTLIQGLNVVSADVDGLMYVEFDVLAGATSLRLQIDVGAVSGTGTPVLDVGELTVINLTTGGLLV